MQDQEQKIASISQEIGLFQLNQLAKNEELEKRLNTHEDWMKGFDIDLKNLEVRIKTLEDSRQRQIALNSTFAVKAKSEDPIKKSIQATTFSFWDLFK